MGGAQRPSDEELMLAAKSGCLESFEALIALHRGTVVRFLMRMHPDPDVVEDACQETFLRLWLHRKSYAPTGRFTSYLLQIAKNVLIGRLRRRRTTPLGAEDCLEDESSPTADQFVIDVERRLTIERCLDSLPVHLSEVFRVVVIDEMKYAEAAELLDVPIGTIKSRMHEAIKRLRTALQEEGFQ